VKRKKKNRAAEMAAGRGQGEAGQRPWRLRGRKHLTKNVLEEGGKKWEMSSLINPQLPKKKRRQVNRGPQEMKDRRLRKGSKIGKSARR